MVRICSNKNICSIFGNINWEKRVGWMTRLNTNEHINRRDLLSLSIFFVVMTLGEASKKKNAKIWDNAPNKMGGSRGKNVPISFWYFWNSWEGLNVLKMPELEIRLCIWPFPMQMVLIMPWYMFSERVHIFQKCLQFKNIGVFRVSSWVKPNWGMAPNFLFAKSINCLGLKRTNIFQQCFKCWIWYYVC